MASPTKQDQRTSRKKVAVVGAGVSGLAAAYKLKSHGFIVTLLEADPRAGGKLRSVSYNGLIWDEGANTMVHHLQFADDTLLLSDFNTDCMDNLISIVLLFELASGLNVNSHKSEILGINIEEDIVQAYANRYGFKRSDWPTTYLGLPLGGKPYSSAFWHPMMEIFEKKIKSWKHSHISKGGRLTLIQATIANLPTYFMSLFQMPSNIASSLEGMIRTFLWKGSNEKKGPNLVKWSKLTLNMEQGGLGLHSIKTKNTALLAKWSWRFVNERNAFWRCIIKAKYGLTHLSEFSSNRKLCRATSPWRTIAKHTPLVMQNITNKLGSGDYILFWKDIWLSNDTLNNTFPRLYLLSNCKNATVKDFRDEMNLSWNLHLRRNLNDDEAAEYGLLLHLLESTHLSTNIDRVSWKLNESGCFTTNSIVQLMELLPIDPLHSIYPFIWKGPTPKKIKFLLWEITHKAINTNDKLQRRMPNWHLSPQWCILCKKDLETQGHIFSSCNFARAFWDQILDAFEWSCPLPIDPFLLVSCIVEGHPFKNNAKYLWEAFSRAFFWSLWCERNKRIFQDLSTPYDRFFEKIVIMVVSWVKRLSCFRDYSFSSILSNWKALL